MPNDKTFDPAKMFVAVNEHLSSDLGEESVILSISNGKYYGLNRVSQDIWTAIQTPASLDTIVEFLLEKYEVDRERCLEEVTAALQRLLDEGLVKLVEPES